MGMFDEVRVTCPGCGADVHFQSKAGACSGSTFDVHSVPLEIAKDLDGESVWCDCGPRLITLQLPEPTIRMLVTSG